MKRFFLLFVSQIFHFQRDSLVNYEDTLHVDKDYSFADLLLKDDTSPAVRGSLIEISSGGEIPFCQSKKSKIPGASRYLFVPQIKVLLWNI